MDVFSDVFDEIGCHSVPICIASFCLLVLINFIFIPFSIYITCKYYSLLKVPLIFHKHRYPNMVLFLSTLNILFLIVASNFLLIFNGIILDSAYTKEWMLWIAPMIYEPWILLIILLGIARSWLICFKINLNVTQNRQEWQSLLMDNNYCGWYSANKRKWGNWKYLMKYLISVWIILSILIIIPLIVPIDISSISEFAVEEKIGAFIALLLSFSCLIIWYKVKRFDDEYYIFREMKLQIICAILFSASWFTLLFWSKRGNAFHIGQIAVISIFCFMQPFISEFIIIHQLRNSHEGTDGTNVAEMKFAQRELLPIILASDAGLELYIEHLQKSFCMENFLFLIESLQWIYGQTKKNWAMFDIRPCWQGNIEYKLSKIIAISSINNDKKTDWYTKINKIYQKYVPESATYQINLPFFIRIEFDNLCRLYQMKLEIEANTYKVKKWVKKEEFVKQHTPSWKSMSIFDRAKKMTLRKDRTNHHNKARSASPAPVNGSKLRRPQLNQLKISQSAPNKSTKKTVTFNSLATQSPVIEEEEDSQYPDAIPLENQLVQDKSETVSLIKAETIDTEQRLVEVFDEVMEMKSDTTHSASGITNTSSVRTVRFKVTVDEEPMTAISMENIQEDAVSPVSKIHLSSLSSTPEAKESEIGPESPDTCNLSTPDPEPFERDHRKSTLELVDVESGASLNDFLDHVMPSLHADIEKTSSGRNLNLVAMDIAMHQLQKSSSMKSLKTDPGDTLREMKSMSQTPIDNFNMTLRENLAGVGSGGTQRSYTRKKSKTFTRGLTSLFSTRVKVSQTITAKQMEELDEEMKREYEIDEDERKEMELCKEIGLQQFITVCCSAIEQILQLNYQSIGRFRHSEYFAAFNEAVDLKHSLEKERKRHIEMESQMISE